MNTSTIGAALDANKPVAAAVRLVPLKGSKVAVRAGSTIYIPTADGRAVEVPAEHVAALRRFGWHDSPDGRVPFSRAWMDAKRIEDSYGAFVEALAAEGLHPEDVDRVETILAVEASDRPTAADVARWASDDDDDVADKERRRLVA